MQMPFFRLFASLVALFSCATWVCPQAALARQKLLPEEVEQTELTYLGFLDDAHRPRIHVRTGEATLARLEKLGADHWALHLPHAQIVRHVMSLPLDTSCFASAVERIEPEPQEEPQSGTVVNIHLRRPVNAKLTRHGNNLFVTLEAKTGRSTSRPSSHSHEGVRISR